MAGQGSSSPNPGGGRLPLALLQRWALFLRMVPPTYPESQEEGLNPHITVSQKVVS